MKHKLLVLALSLCVTAPAFSQIRDPASEFTRTNPKFLSAFKGAVGRPSASTVRVLAAGKETALGMVVGPDGWILTKANDLQGAITVRLRDGKTYDAEIVGIHTPHDLALLKIDARGLVPIEFKESKVADVGSWVACVGLSDEPVAVGVISVATRNIANKGPAFNLSKTPYLGVMLEPNDGGGVKIMQIVDGAPASKIGLKVNDVILSVSGAKVTDQDSFMAIIGKKQAGDSVMLKIRRGKEELDQSAKLEKRPAAGARSDIQNKMGSELSSRNTGYGTILQHDSVVKPADCGGPIVDLDGRVLGMNICRAGRVESWAVPSEIIQPILLELMSGKLAPASSQTGSMLTPEEKLNLAKAAVQKAERDKTRYEKEIEDARRALQSAEIDFKAFRRKDSADSSDKLLKVMTKRLLAMHEVAAWKWNHRQDVFDADREKEALAKLQLRAKEHGIDKKVVDRFFKAQVEAGKLLQQDSIANWQKDEVLAKENGDLKKDLRPKLDQLNDELFDCLVALFRYWKDAELNMPLDIRQRASGTLAGQGISDAVRRKALGGLVTP